MAEDKFKTFKKRYDDGKIPEMAMPPIVPGPGGALRSAAGMVARPLVRYLADTAKAAAKEAKVAGRNKSLDKAGKVAGKQKNALRRGNTGTMTDKLAATRSRPRTEKESEKFGALVKRKDNLPAKQSRALIKREDNLPAVREVGRRDLAVLRQRDQSVGRPNSGGRSVAVQGTRTFGDKGQTGRIVGLSPKGKLAAGIAGAGVVAAGAAAYKKAGSAGASGNGGGYATGPRDDRASSNSNIQTPAPNKGDKSGSSVGGTANGPFKSEFAKKLQGQNPGVKKATDKSRTAKAAPAAPAAPKKLTNFERMKMRGYEKEGYGGRSMTTDRARAQVTKERGYKFSDLFKKKK